MIRISRGITNKDVEEAIRQIHVGKIEKATKKNIPKWFQASGDTDLEKLYYQKTIVKSNLLILKKEDWEATKEKIITTTEDLEIYFAIKLRYYKTIFFEFDIPTESGIVDEVILKWEILPEQNTYGPRDQEKKDLCNVKLGAVLTEKYYLPINECFKIKELKEQILRLLSREDCFGERKTTLQKLSDSLSDETNLKIQLYKTLSTHLIRTAEKVVYREHLDKALNYFNNKTEE